MTEPELVFSKKILQILVHLRNKTPLITLIMKMRSKKTRL